MIIKQQQGSFLLEFLISLAIFSIAITGLVKLQNRSMSDLSDTTSDMAIPILISEFTARMNLTDGSSLAGIDESELKATALAMQKDVSFSGKTITISDLIDPTRKTVYTVVLDRSRIVPDGKE